MRQLLRRPHAKPAPLRHVQQRWPSHDTAELAVLQAAVEQLAAPSEKPTPPTPTGAATDLDALSAEPCLEALTRLSRGTALLERDDRAGAYYYHRFYHFQPEVHMACPEVREE